MDTNAKVIKQESAKNRNHKGLLFSVDDAKKLTLADSTFDVVLDKGTLAAMFPSPQPADEQKEMLSKMFSKVARVLKPMGRYLIVTLAQEHILDFWLKELSEICILKVHKEAKNLPNDVQSLAHRIVRRLMKGETMASFSDDEIYVILEAVRRVLLCQSAFIEMTAPLVIFGDIHGQFQDLLRFFKVVGSPPKTKCLFLGDYVDRCGKSLEVIMLLLSLKLLYPSKIELLRGNHECAKINRSYGFYEELRRKRTVFNELPLCALVSKRIFCMHGGISPHITSWDIVRQLKKPQTVKECDEGIALDLMWADPTQDTCGFVPNMFRSVSYLFGDDAVKQFCAKLNVDMIVRAHELVMDGHAIQADGQLCTIFTAPNYCGTDRNSGSVMRVTKTLQVSFETMRPKTILPNTLDKRRKALLEKLTRSDPTAKSPMPQHKV
ncbi:unnamed protein product, partial [Mesorhabditis belari]|uniref:Serine/threonine-protein phosphatase n=1 Tax=Mesorhabditis belari TaxID=2138241 RepID=A0AAF3F5L7_9BILA